MHVLGRYFWQQHHHSSFVEGFLKKAYFMMSLIGWFAIRINYNSIGTITSYISIQNKAKNINSS